MAPMTPFRAAVAAITSEHLRLTKSAAADLAGAALDAKNGAGLEDEYADLIVVAVPAGEGSAATAAIERALDVGGGP